MTDGFRSPSDDPIMILLEWLADAAEHDAIQYAGAATLATVDGDGADARIVLVHEVDGRGLLFGTDTRSPKAHQLRLHPSAALTFYWSPLERQIRIRGTVELADEAAAEKTFDDRPRGSRITAWACQQSREVSDRRVLEGRFAQAEGRFDAGHPVPRPDTWRAYRLVPESLEFWTAQRFRLHDRQAFQKEPNGRWRRFTLEP
ncbi:MAG: pyridoxamine 5'-phosphate oxidase [Acidobacteriota bacterium]